MITTRAKWALVLLIVLTALAITGCAQKEKKPPEPVKVSKDYGLADALWAACQECNIESVRELIDAGADVNARSGINQTTPLMETVRSYDNKCPADLVVMLVEAGAKLNLQDARGYTALHYSARFNCGQAHIEATRALLENGADPGILSKDKKTALELATIANCADKVDLLVEYIKSYRQKLDEVIPDPTKKLIPAPQAGQGQGEAEALPKP
jgi:ankyrin repeat protein